MVDRKWDIYALSDPRDGLVRYVGVSHIGKKRFNRHIAEARRGVSSHRHDWIRSVLAAGKTPDYRIIETGYGAGWVEAEVRWISHFRELGCDLTNCTLGGEGNLGYYPSAASREKMAAAKRGKPRSPETKAKISASSKCRKKTAEHTAKCTAAKLGKPRSSETRAKLAKAATGKTQSAEQRAKRSASLKGRKKPKRSPEHSARIAAALKGRELPPEHRAAISHSLKNGRSSLSGSIQGSVSAGSI